MTRIDQPSDRSIRQFITTALALCTLGLAAATPPATAQTDDFPQVVEGQAILAHPAGQAILEAARQLQAGRLDIVRKASVKDVRDEWAAMSEAERQNEIARNTERAPDPKAFEADIARVGVLTIYGESATLRIPRADDDTAAMAFVSLEGGHWKVTAGPMTFEPPPVETAPPIAGADILDHPIGTLALEYAKRLETGSMEDAVALLSSAAQAARTGVPPEERADSDAFRLRQLPDAATLSDQIRSGGQLSFFGDKAYLNVITNETTANPDGSTTFTSNTTGLSFELEDGAWRIGS